MARPRHITSHAAGAAHAGLHEKTRVDKLRVDPWGAKIVNFLLETRNFVSKITQNEKLRIKNEEFCIKSDELCR